MDRINKKSKIVIVSVCSVILLVTILLVGQNALASSGVIHTPAIITKVVNKFYPKQSVAKKDIQQKKETPAPTQKDLQTLLNGSVRSGTITRAQEALILGKETSIEQQVSTILVTSKNASARQNAISKLIVQTQLWATENGISAVFITEFLSKMSVLNY